MSKIRLPAVAGLFYPGDANILHHDIQKYLDSSKVKTLERVPRAIIVPHAGYVYSGAVAASAYKQIIPFKHKINRVVLLGPSHRVAFTGLAVPESDVFNTPFGNISIDLEMVKKILTLPQVSVSERAHYEEHSLEVQLPFLQEILDDFSLVPIVVGDVERHDVADVIKLLLKNGKNTNTLIVISTDLSHYHEYDEANKRDHATSDAIVHLEPEYIGFDDACGRNGLNGMLTVAEQKQYTIELLDLKNSGDVSGSKERVVGYGAYVIH